MVPCGEGPDGRVGPRARLTAVIAGLRSRELVPSEAGRHLCRISFSILGRLLCDAAAQARTARGVGPSRALRRRRRLRIRRRTDSGDISKSDGRLGLLARAVATGPEHPTTFGACSVDHEPDQHIRCVPACPLRAHHSGHGRSSSGGQGRRKAPLASTFIV
jgi:hypothetical protein